MQAAVTKLERRTRILSAVMVLLLALLRVPRFSLDHRRLPDGARKADLLRAIERARGVLPLRSALGVVGLCAFRYHAWVQAQARSCSLDDGSPARRRDRRR